MGSSLELAQVLTASPQVWILTPIPGLEGQPSGAAHRLLSREGSFPLALGAHGDPSCPVVGTLG